MSAGTEFEQQALGTFPEAEIVGQRTYAQVKEQFRELLRYQFGHIENQDERLAHGIKVLEDVLETQPENRWAVVLMLDEYRDIQRRRLAR